MLPKAGPGFPPPASPLEDMKEKEDRQRQKRRVGEMSCSRDPGTVFIHQMKGDDIKPFKVHGMKPSPY